MLGTEAIRQTEPSSGILAFLRARLNGKMTIFGATGRPGRLTDFSNFHNKMIDYIFRHDIIQRCGGMPRRLRDFALIRKAERT